MLVRANKVEVASVACSEVPTMTVSQLPATALPADSGGLTNRLVGSFKATASETPKVMAYEAAATDMSHKPILGVFVFRRYASTKDQSSLDAFLPRARMNGCQKITIISGANPQSRMQNRRHASW